MHVRKLNEAQAKRVRRLARSGSWPQYLIARLFRISQPHVSMIKHRLRWGGV